MSIVRFQIDSPKGEVVRTEPEGTCDALIVLDIDTTRVEAERGRRLNTVHQKDIVLDALNRLIEAVKDGGKQP